MSNHFMHTKSEKAVTTSQSQENGVNLPTSQEPTPTDSTSTSHLRASICRLTHHTRKQQQSNHADGKQKTSISDSGPFSFVFDPATGKQVLGRNPHWPNEDSGKKEKDTEGDWAFGSLMGQPKDDFGGTVG
jgi:hypothetical protein